MKLCNHTKSCSSIITKDIWLQPVACFLVASYYPFLNSLIQINLCPTFNVFWCCLQIFWIICWMSSFLVQFWLRTHNRCVHGIWSIFLGKVCYHHIIDNASQNESWCDCHITQILENKMGTLTRTNVDCVQNYHCISYIFIRFQLF